MKKYLFILLVLTSCGPLDRANRKLNKAERLTQSAIELGAEVKRDTVWITKEVIVPEVKTDTVIELVGFNLQDTIFIERERLKIKVKLDTLFREIFVEAKCQPDTVKIEVPVSIDTSIKTGYSTYEIIGIGIFFCFIGILVGFIIVFFKQRNSRNFG